MKRGRVEIETEDDDDLDLNDEEGGDDDWGFEDEEEDLREESKGGKRRDMGKRAPRKGKQQRVKRGSGASARAGGSGGRSIFQNRIAIWTTRVMVTLIVLLLLFAPIPCLESAREDMIGDLKDLMKPYKEFPDWVNVTMSISYDMTMSRRGPIGTTDNLVLVKLAPPFDIPPDGYGGESKIQDVFDVTLNNPEYLFNRVLDWNTESNVITGWRFDNDYFSRISSDSVHLKATYEVALFTHEWKYEKWDVGKVEDISKAKHKTTGALLDYSLYLEDQWAVVEDDVPTGDFRYHPSAPEIDSKAHELTDDEETVLDKVRSIYEWIRDNFEYDTQNSGSLPKPALKCLSDRTGDCDDQSLLMASLCRAVGIPAWLEVGYLYDTNSKSWGGHGWFNVLIPVREGSGFAAMIVPIDPVNEEFLFRDPFRITDWIDNGGYINDGEEDKFNLDYYYNYYSKYTSNSIEVTSKAPSTNSERYEPHGSYKYYVDDGLEDLPSPNPLLLAFPLLILAMIPAVRRSFGRRLK